MATPAYPQVRQYGDFPPSARNAISAAVAKREKALKSMRNTKGVGSESILGVLALDLSRIGFGTEPKGFAVGPKEFEVDRYDPIDRIGLEVEKGRVMLGHQLHLDLLKFHMIEEIEYGVVILPESSREESEEPFRVACVLLDALYSRPELKLDFDGLLIVGY
jgi:hypothetical protein